MTGGRLEGKVAVITGAASGIGEGAARLFVEQGARVVLVDLQEEAGRWLAKELDGSAVFVQADVSSESEVAGAVAAALASYGRLDCMLNNAGILGATGPITETSGHDWARTIDVLLNSVFYGTKYAARAMIGAGSGTIINTASTAGVRAGLGPHAYTAAKHAVVGLTQSTAAELGRSGIRVNALAPGGTVTAMTAYVTTGDALDLDGARDAMAGGPPLGRAGVPLDIAQAALFLASDESSWINGAVIVVDGGGEVIGDRSTQFFHAGGSLVESAGRTGW